MGASHFLECGDWSPLLAGDLSPSNPAGCPYSIRALNAPGCATSRPARKRRQVAALQRTDPPLSKTGRRPGPTQGAAAQVEVRRRELEAVADAGDELEIVVLA